MSDLSRTDVIAAMQLAVLSNDWRLASQLGTDHLDTVGYVDFHIHCRWCGQRTSHSVRFHFENGTNRLAMCETCETDRPWRRTT